MHVKLNCYFIIGENASQNDISEPELNQTNYWKIFPLIELLA